jgi:hypothetical protein
MADEENKTVKIKITETDETHRFAGGRVPVSVNGQIAHIAIGEEVEVGEHVTSVLKDAGIPFTVVEPSGSAGSSAEGVSVDDPRELVVSDDDPNKGGQDAANATEQPPELEQDLAPPSGNESGEPKNAANSGGDTGGETVGGILGKSIPDLTTALNDVTDAGQLDTLLADEKAGRNRAGAVSAIEARKAALAA